MATDSYPVAAAFAVLLTFLFLILLATWCCKQLARPKVVSLAPPRRYISTIDVQTGMPVVVDLSAIATAPSQTARRTSCPPRSYTTFYGSIAHAPPSSGEVLARTPPPPYSEVAVPQ